LKKNPGEAPEGFWNVGTVEGWKGGFLGQSQVNKRFTVVFFPIIPIFCSSILAPGY
jgi:hypothetical protein